MKILFATSEMTPFVKTGGLADVGEGLPCALAELGHEVAVVLPFYSQVDREKIQVECVLPEVLVDLPAGKRVLAIWRTKGMRNAECGMANEEEGYAKSRKEAAKDRKDEMRNEEEMRTGPSGVPGVTVYLVEDRGLFTRPNLYADGKREYSDNPLRFAYYCVAAIWMLKGLDWFPDVIHCNDWQTALIPTFLRQDPAMKADPVLSRIRVLFTIHNIAYQGIYPEYMLRLLGLPKGLGAVGGDMEFHSSINYMKGALLNSDQITTVSPTYAREIQTAEYGCGLEGVLREHAGRLTGILNGIDARAWDPATDPTLAARYSREDKSGKAACKRALQERFGLPARPDVPLIGMVARLMPQKGLDLIVQAFPELMAEEMQFVLLGTGMEEYERFFTEEARIFRGKMGVATGFSNELAHQIEAGADIFLMPSRYEPCGLNQMYSLRYGTPPVVRMTGGLADSIMDANPSTIVWGKGTGFVFGPYEMPSMMRTIVRALKLYREDQGLWAKLMDNAMAQDFSWGRSAREYEALLLERMAG